MMDKDAMVHSIQLLEMQVDSLRAELAKKREAREEAKKEIAHQKERKQSIGNELNKWRSRAIAHRSRAEAAKAQVAVLKEILTRVNRIAYNSRRRASGHNCEGTAGCQAIHDIATPVLQSLPAHAAKYQVVIDAAIEWQSRNVVPPEFSDEIALDEAVRQLKED